MPVSPSDLAVAHSRHTVWATDFPVWATEKTVAQTVEVPLGHEKRAPQRPLSSFPLQRYNKTRRKANRRRRTQNGKIRKKGKWRRVVVPCPLTWHSVLVAAPAATPFLCRRNAAVPGMSRCKCNSCKRRQRPRWARVQKVHLRIARALPSTKTNTLVSGLGCNHFS